MSKKYFVTSDNHGFYDELMSALNDAGFDINNPEHILVMLGDIFDRGPKPKQMYEFLSTFPKSRLFLVKGNHEAIILDIYKNYMKMRRTMKERGNNTALLSATDMIFGGYFDSTDYSNGTVQTLCNLFGFNGSTIETDCLEQAKLIEKFGDSDVKKWLESDAWLDYLELGDYIFVHSFIPMKNKSHVSMYSQFGHYSLKYNPNWRTNSTELEWEESRWGCPWQQFSLGYFNEELKKGKKLVCGHWNTSDFFNNLDKPAEKRRFEDCPIYNKNGLIGLDACTTLSGKVNVLVLDENELSSTNTSKNS